MEKKIEDYLHLYFGQGCKITDRQTCIIDTIKGPTITNSGLIWKVEPILRPLSDMTEEEYATMLIIANQNNIKILERDEIVLRQTAPEIMRYLLSKSFDLFGLIDAGLAIDKTKI